MSLQSVVDNFVSGKRFLGLLLVCLGMFPAGRAQSKDGAHPAPLSPGVNKGNAVNFDGNQYWYFYAGPGHFDVRMAFHEMGLLGNPYRQNMTFEMVNDAGKVIYHGVVASQGNTATISTFGDYDSRKRIRVAVMPQAGLIRMGGYYEFEVTGAASFDGKAGASANVQAEGTESLVKSGGGPLVTSSGPLVRSGGGPLVTSSGPLVTNSGPLVKSGGGPLVYPGRGVVAEEAGRELRLRLATDVLFDFGRAEIRPDAAATLQELANRIRAVRASRPILIEGYTDAKGNPEANLRLSEQRAEAVEIWLNQHAGFAISAFEPRGMGASHPIAPNQRPNGQDDPQGRQLNRRVEVVVVR